METTTETCGPPGGLNLTHTQLDQCWCLFHPLETQRSAGEENHAAQRQQRRPVGMKMITCAGLRSLLLGDTHACPQVKNVCVSVGVSVGVSLAVSVTLRLRLRVCVFVYVCLHVCWFLRVPFFRLILRDTYRTLSGELGLGLVSFGIFYTQRAGQISRLS